MPIVKTVEKFKQLELGEVLEVVADDKGIKEDIKDWCRVTGNECLGIEAIGVEIRVYVKKGYE
jgi:TusA-related sulfurtransferase